MVWGRPRPTIDMMVNRISSPGIDTQASTKRCTARSTLPPRNPDVPPTSMATTTLRAVAPSPTVSETRAPLSGCYSSWPQ